MGTVHSMSQARIRRAKKKADEKFRQEEERNKRQRVGTKLQQALDKYGSFTGDQLKKKKEKDDDKL